MQPAISQAVAGYDGQRLHTVKYLNMSVCVCVHARAYIWRERLCVCMQVCAYAHAGVAPVTDLPP